MLPPSLEGRSSLKKPHVLVIALGALLTSWSPASAQVYGQFTGAQTVANGGRMFGAYLVSSENVLGVLGQLRLSFYPNVDFGFVGGISRIDTEAGNRTTLRLGTGLKVMISDSSATLPVAIALVGDLGIETGDDFHVLSVAPAIVASRGFGMGSSSFTPYARAGITISNVDLGDISESDVSFPLHIGAEFMLAQQLRLAAEIQLHLDDDFGDDVGVAAGVNLPF
jgi:opacity protein-like surface antigen